MTTLKQRISFQALNTNEPPIMKLYDYTVHIFLMIVLPEILDITHRNERSAIVDPSG